MAVAAFTTRDEADIGPETRFLLTPSAFGTVYTGPRRNIATTFGTEKLEWRGYPKILKIMFIHVDRIHERDGQTDGQTDRRTPYDGIGCAAKILIMT